MAIEDNPGGTSGSANDAANAELSSLRQRAAELETEVRDLRQANQALRTSEERFRALVMAASPITWVTTADGSVNGDLPDWRAFTGLSLTEIQGRGWADAVHPEDRERTSELWQQALGTGSAYEGEIRLRKHDGSYHDFTVRATPTRGPDGRIQEWIGICMDITERKTAERALRVSEKRFRTLMSHAPIGVFQTDATGDFVYVNGCWCAIAGVSATEAQGSNWSRTVHPEDRDRVIREWYEAARTNRGFDTEYRFMTPEGKTTWVCGSAVAFHDDVGNVLGYYGTITDVTARKEAEELQRQSRHQAQVIRVQEAALDELSTPLIPISDQIMVMPLIGTMDTRRAQQVLETLLAGIADNRARIAILDITGVSMVDTQVAEALIRAARAVRLLGAQIVLSGIRPEVAQTLVTLGADLTGIVACGTLQTAIAYATNAAG